MPQPHQLSVRSWKHQGLCSLGLGKLSSLCPKSFTAFQVLPKMSTPPESPLGLEQDPGMEAREGSPRQGQLDGHSSGPLDSLLIPDPLLCGLKSLGTPDWRKAAVQEGGSELPPAGLRGLPGKCKGSLSPFLPLLSPIWASLKLMERGSRTTQTAKMFSGVKKKCYGKRT